jgi:hypothetical protein
MHTRNASCASARFSVACVATALVEATNDPVSKPPQNDNKRMFPHALAKILCRPKSGN